MMMMIQAEKRGSEGLNEEETDGWDDEEEDEEDDEEEEEVDSRSVVDGRDKSGSREGDEGFWVI